MCIFMLFMLSGDIGSITEIKNYDVITILILNNELLAQSLRRGVRLILVAKEQFKK